jgi:Fic-DOC domain mobile mystery protein B
MTRKIDDYISGQSPLPPSWKKDLIPPINTYQELNEHESLSIRHAIQKFQFGGRKTWPVSDFQFVKKLHREMYDGVWIWAGQFRLSNQELNIGVEAGKISMELARACQDCQFWMQNQTYSAAETAVRYHHKIVSIHPFPNGNGRLSRFIGNLTMMSLGEEVLSWGGEDISKAGATRDEYITALQEADGKRFERLLSFAQTA